MKKILLIILLVLAGCSGVPESKSESLKSETEADQPKGEFSFTLDDFIEEYNKQINKGHYDDKEKIPSHLQKDSEFFEVNGGYIHILAKESDSNNGYKDYTLSSIHDKDKNLKGIDLRIRTAFNKDKVLNFSSTGTLAGYKLVKTLNFEEEALQTALKEANPEYSVSNEICELTLKYQLKKKTILIEIRPPK